MRDPKLMISLLHEMAAEASGRIVTLYSYGMNNDEQNRYHHLELLIDAKHAEWVDGHFVRITNTGYDFINAIGQDQKYRDQFLDLFNRGMKFVDAAAKIIKIVTATVDNFG